MRYSFTRPSCSDELRPSRGGELFTLGQTRKNKGRAMCKGQAMRKQRPLVRSPEETSVSLQLSSILAIVFATNCITRSFQLSMFLVHGAVGQRRKCRVRCRVSSSLRCLQNPYRWSCLLYWQVCKAVHVRSVAGVASFRVSSMPAGRRRTPTMAPLRRWGCPRRPSSWPPRARVWRSAVRARPHH